MALKFSSIGGGGIQSGTTANRPASPEVGDQYYNGTLGRLEIYNGTQWMAVGGQVRTPTVSTVADVGTNRAFNDGAIDVTVIPNVNGGVPTSYTVTSSPGSFTASGLSPVRVAGLASNTAYTFTAVASNDYGSDSSASAASSSATATTVPQAPTVGLPTVVAGTAFGGSPSLSVPFTANATGGKAITSYTVTSSPGSITASGASSPIVVPGLTAAQSYTFTVTATNANGTSAASASSNSVSAATAPGTATLGTAFIADVNKVGIPYTINNGGGSITSWSVGVSPSLSGTSTITFDATNVYISNPNWAFNQAYTFTLTATNAAGTGGTSSASNSVIPVKAYSQTQTYTSSTTYTVPSGTNKLAVYAFSGSESGGGGSGTSSGGAGGRGARGIALSEFGVNAGQTFNVTIGGSGGTTSFGNILSVSPNAGNSNVAGSVSAAGGAGAPASGTGPGSDGSAGSALTLNQAGLTTFNTGGGGAAGGAGVNDSGSLGNTSSQQKYGRSSSGFSGGTNFTAGGSGGGGGWTGYLSDYGQFNFATSGSPGSAGTFTGNAGANGGGGGGGHGTVGGSTQSQWPYSPVTNGAGGAGGPGKVIIYES